MRNGCFEVRASVTVGAGHVNMFTHEREGCLGVVKYSGGDVGALPGQGRMACIAGFVEFALVRISVAVRAV